MGDVLQIRRSGAYLIIPSIVLLTGKVQAAPAESVVHDESVESSPCRICAVLRVDLVYLAHQGGDFTGSETIAFANAALLNVPKLAPGLGYLIRTGAVFGRIVPQFNLIATVNYGQTSHSSRSAYPAVFTSNPNANLSLLELELDLMYENRFIRPFVGVSSGLAWLDLPGTQTNVNVTLQTATYGLNASLSGYAIRPKLGAMAEVFRGALVNLEFGYGFYSYRNSSIATLAPYGLVAHGVTLNAGMMFLWPN